MTSILTSELPAGQTLEMPCNNLLTTTMQTTTTAAIAPTAVTGVLFVDRALGTATGNGSLGAPYQTIQQAVTAAVALLLVEVVIKAAPGVYDGVVVIPNTLSVSVVGWGPVEDTFGLGNTQLTGDITLTGGGRLQLAWLAAYMTTITTSAPLVDTLSVSMTQCDASPALVAGNVALSLNMTQHAGDVLGAITVSVETDDYSWRWIVSYGATYSPGYTRTFFGAGHGVFSTNLSLNGLAIGTTGFDTLAVGTHVRGGDRAAIQVVDPAVQDFICGIHGVGAGGAVTVWITNLSRVSTNFADAIVLTYHHQTMILEPGP